MSMHDSGRMLLALYANGVLRLWNMLDARCLFKFKAGMSANGDSEQEGEEMRDGEHLVEEEKIDQVKAKFLQTDKVKAVLK